MTSEDDASLRASIRQRLSDGATPHDVYRDFGEQRAAWLIALEEEAHLNGTHNQTDPTPEAVAALRDDEALRWERIAVRVFGDPSCTAEVKQLYDEARGPGAAKQSYTGRGRRFPEMS